MLLLCAHVFTLLLNKYNLKIIYINIKKLHVVTSAINFCNYIYSLHGGPLQLFDVST